jgi:hypothetical protein
MNFIKLYEEDPTIAIVIYASFVAFVILSLSILAYLKHYEKVLEEKFKRKYKIK